MFLSFKEDFEKFARVVLYIFIATFPFLSYKGFIYSGASSRALNLILIVEVLVICLAFLLFQKNTKFSVPKSPISLGLIVLFLSLLISSIFGVDFTASFWSKITRASGLFYFIHLGVFYFFLIMLFNQNKNLRRLLEIFLISSVVFSIGAILSKEGLDLIFKTHDWGGGFTLGNSSFAAMYMYAAFILGVYYVYSLAKANRRWWNFLIPVVIGLNPYFINYHISAEGINLFQNPLAILGGAKASSYAFVFSLLLLLVIYGVSKIRNLNIRRSFIYGATIIGLVVASIAVYSLLTPGGFIQDQYLKQGSNARPLVWQLSKKAIDGRPMLGYGVDNFGRSFETYYDNKVMESANGAEAWFDRAHNIFVDQTIETGYIGIGIYILLYILIIFSMLYILLKGEDKDDQIFAVFIIVYFIGHLMEIQTAFDTTISYVPFTMVVSFAAILFHRTYSNRVGEKSVLVIGEPVRYMTGVVLIFVFGGLFFVGSVPIIRSNIANGEIRTVGASDKRVPLYKTLFNSPMDKAGLINRTFNDFRRGLSTQPQLLQDPTKVEGYKKELAVFQLGYEDYLKNNPKDYRAQINLAELYIYQKLMGVDNLDKVHDVALTAINLVPQAPQAYWQNSVVYLYQRKFDLAREWAQKAYDLNPDVFDSKRLQDYLEESIKTFPEINFYNFNML
jgi:O-antigen ligase